MIVTSLASGASRLGIHKPPYPHRERAFVHTTVPPIPFEHGGSRAGTRPRLVQIHPISAEQLSCFIVGQMKKVQKKKKRTPDERCESVSAARIKALFHRERPRPTS